MKVKMHNVRLSFPSLFNTEKFGGEDTGKFAATFLLDKTDHADLIKEIQSAMQSVADEKLKGKLPPADKLCLKDGDETDREEMAGKMTIKASGKKRPLVIDRDKTPLNEEDGKPYAGCYVNAIIDVWAQNNEYGKRVNAQLNGVQFFGDGEPFGAPGIDAEEFDDFDDDVEF